MGKAKSPSGIADWVERRARSRRFNAMAREIDGLVEGYCVNHALAAYATRPAIHPKIFHRGVPAIPRDPKNPQGGR